MRVSNIMLRSASAAAMLFAGAGAAMAQPVQLPSSGLTLDQIVIRAQPESQGRGAPLPPVPDTMVGADLKGVQGGMGPPINDGRAVVAAMNGDVPEGITPLERDIFTSDDFYKDRDLWMDPRYYRCMSSWGMENVWGGYEAPTTGDDPPQTIAWGFCDRDYPRDQIVSPYPYKTAQAHYEALLAEAQSRGGPTIYSRENPPPDWSGNYNVNGFGQFGSTRSWMSGAITQLPTYLSLLTPEYQRRMVQQMWHDAHNQVIWPGAFCWPDGFERRWFGGRQTIMVTPDLVQVRSRVNEAIVTDIYVGREFNMATSVPTLSTDNRQWFGETIGFWDGDALITWTSNVKGWIAHGWFETSNELQSIEIYTPIDSPDGTFVGLVHDAILYDPEALAEPVRIVGKWEYGGGLGEPISPVGWTQCIPSIFPINGQQTPVNAGETIEYTVPDMSGRPWADIWENYFEPNMERPQRDDVLAGFQ